MAKVNLEKEAASFVEETELEGEITEEILLEFCPPEFLDAFKKAKTQGQRADLLYAADKHRLECARDVAAQEKFIAKLKRWFIQQLPDNDATGIAGKTARVQVKRKENPHVFDWDKFYAHIKKNSAFELLNRAVNTKAVKERWENNKEVPGVGKLSVRTVSLTKI